MCGRYVAEEDKSIDLAALYRVVRADYPSATLKSGEIYPTDTVPLLTGAGLIPRPGKWGFPGFDGKGVIINARAETAAQKPTFCDAFRAGRCIIPATGYFEWDPAKGKHLFSPASGGLLYMAGLFRPTPEGLRFVILTTPSEPVPVAAAIHHRMPVLLSAPSAKAWVEDMSFAVRRSAGAFTDDVHLLCMRVG